MKTTQTLYTLAQLATITGLTDRTLRNYISSGLLEGTKINGAWRFTAEQTEQFIRHPTVRPSILAKSNALVYDFLMDTAKSSSEICIILDIPRESGKDASDFFCTAISTGDYSRISFSYDGIHQTPRIILKGDAGQVMHLINAYYAR